MPTRRHVVRVFGPLPPPVHGASRVTRMVADLVAAEAGVEVREFDSNDDVPTAARLRRMLRGLADLAFGRRGTVYLGGAGGEVLWYQALVVVVARLRRQRIAFHHHNFSYLHERSTAMAVLCRGGGHRVRHVVLGDTMAAALRSTYRGASDVRVCSNAALLGPPETSHTRPASGPLVLGHLSNLSREKGVDVVVDALRSLRAAGVDASLVLAGPCADDDARAVVEAAQVELGDALEVTGAIEPDRVDEVYRRIDVFVFPSRYRNEAEPLVVLDAMRWGVESVAFDTGCLRELVEPALLVPLGGDLPAAVATRGLDVRGSSTAVVRYAQRREHAQAALHELVAHLVDHRA